MDAQRYDRARPRYPGTLIDRIVATAPGRQVLDVGVGTGIVARQFRAAGCTVLGVEPDPRMAAFAGRYGIDVEVAKFETWDAAGRRFDAVVAGQSWHWVEPVAGAAKAADVLRPGGRLALFWNVAQFAPALTDAFAAVYDRVAPDSPAARAVGAGRPPLEIYAQLGDVAADGIRAVQAFAEPEVWRFDWEQTYTRDEWLDQIPTQGGHRQLSAETQAAVLAGIASAIDDFGGTLTIQYATVARTAVIER
jgi:SAM-dependent methyltransferase